MHYCSVGVQRSRGIYFNQSFSFFITSSNPLYVCVCVCARDCFDFLQNILAVATGPSHKRALRDKSHNPNHNISQRRKHH